MSVGEVRETPNGTPIRAARRSSSEEIRPLERRRRSSVGMPSRRPRPLELVEGIAPRHVLRDEEEPTLVAQRGRVDAARDLVVHGRLGQLRDARGYHGRRDAQGRVKRLRAGRTRRRHGPGASELDVRPSIHLRDVDADDVVDTVDDLLHPQAAYHKGVDLEGRAEQGDETLAVHVDTEGQLGDDGVPHLGDVRASDLKVYSHGAQKVEAPYYAFESAVKRGGRS